MVRFLKDFFLFPFQHDRTDNKVAQLLTLLGKEYPAFFWQKPTIRRFLMLPFLVIYIIIKKEKKRA